MGPAKGAQGSTLRPNSGERSNLPSRAADRTDSESPELKSIRLDCASGESGAILVPENRSLARTVLRGLERPGGSKAPVVRVARRSDGNAGVGHRLRGRVLFI